MKTYIIAALCTTMLCLGAEGRSSRSYFEDFQVGTECASYTPGRTTTMANGAAVFSMTSGINSPGTREHWKLELRGDVKGPIYANGDLCIVVTKDSTVDFTAPASCDDGDPAISCAYQLKITGPGKLTIRTSGGTGLCGNGTLTGGFGLGSDLVLDGANVKIETTKATGRGLLGQTGFGLYANRLVCKSSTVSVRLKDGSTGDGIYCKVFNAEKSVVMSSGGRRGLFTESKNTIGYGPSLSGRKNGGFGSKNGEVRLVQSALYAFGSAVGIAVGDYAHMGGNTQYGNFWAKDSVVVAQGSSGDGIVSGCCVHFDNVSGAIRGAKCAMRVYADMEIAGGNSSATLALVGGISESGNPATGSALLGAYDGGKSGTQGSAIKVSGGKTTIYCPKGCGIYTPGMVSVSGGSITVKAGNDSSMATLLTQSGLLKQLKALAGISTSANPDALGVRPKSYRTTIRPENGICAQAYKQTKGNVVVDTASKHGMALGWEGASSSDTTVKPARRAPGAFTLKGGYLRLGLPSSGKITVKAKLNKLPDVALSTLDTLLSGTAKMEISGGRLLAGGMKAGILCKGKCTISSGTVWAFSVNTNPKKDLKIEPYMTGVGLYAKTRIVIKGGSVIVNRLAQRPTRYSASSTPLYKACMRVKGSGAAKITGMFPSYYGKKDLYPRGGELWLWLPAGEARLSCAHGYQGKGRYYPSSNRTIKRDDGNVFVHWTKVGSGSSSGQNLVKSPKTTVTVPGIGTITMPDSGNVGKTSSKTSTKTTAKTTTKTSTKTKAKSSGKSSSKTSVSKASGGTAASTATLKAALASAPPLPAGWVRVKFDANGGTTTTHYRDFQVTEYVTYSWSSSVFEFKRFPTLEWIPFPKRPGYAFNGWRTKRNGGTICSPWTLASDITYYANWTKKKAKCQVSFFGNGGKVSGKYVKNASAMYRVFTTTQKFKTFPSASRKGYVFLGWYQRSNRLGPKLTTSHVVPTVNSQLTAWYACWAKKKYKVAFDANGGTGNMAAQAMTYGKAKKLSVNKFKRAGYVFAGWAKSEADADAGKIAYKNGKSVKNLITTGETVRLYAVWRKK